MDEPISEVDATIFGMLNAQQFILENLYALIISRDANPLDSAQRTGREMLRQFEELGSPPEDAVAHVITQHAIHRLERFWVRVEQRLGG